MYQRCFDNASETLFVAGKTPRLSRFAFSDDPKWESGHHVHDNETELIYVKKGVARFTIDSSLYVAHADDIVVIERGRLHAVASDVNDPATTCTCALYGFQFQGAEENQLLQPHSCPVIAAGQGKEVIKTLFNELSVILPQSKNSQTSSLWDAFAYTRQLFEIRVEHIFQLLLAARLAEGDFRLRYEIRNWCTNFVGDIR